MITRGLRLLAGLALAWVVCAAIFSPFFAPVAAVATAATLAVALWRPDVALIIVVILAPAGLLLAPEPARAAEALTWAFLAGWLLRVDRPLSSRGWPTAVVLAATLYAVCVAASWLAVIIADAGGIDPAALPRFVVRAFGTDHLAVTSAEPETWTMFLAEGGIALLLASIALTRADPTMATRISAAVAVSMAALSALSVGDVARQWAQQGFAEGYLQRFVAERFAFHVGDVNAAGSQYLLGGLAALGLALGNRSRRWPWATAVVVILPGLWLTGSRTAALAAVAVGLAVTVFARRGAWRPSRLQLTALATAVIVLLAAGGVVLSRGLNERNAAGRAMRLRVQFSETSVRMFAAAPLFGVGVGRYHLNSGTYMPPEVKALYGSENAHNYFAQQFAELGVVGGGLFIWVIASSLALATRTLRSAPLAATAVVAASVGYVVTCLTGHPLLVPEAALPFWPMLGAAAALAPAPPLARDATWRRVAVGAALALVAVRVGSAAASFGQTPGIEHGFYEFERDGDGTSFRWMARHAATFIPRAPGFLVLTVRAADIGSEPFELATELDGREVDRRIIPADRWTTISVPVRPRPRSSAPTQRIDLRVSHSWSRPQRLGRRLTLMPVSLMVRQVHWAPAG